MNLTVSSQTQTPTMSSSQFAELLGFEKKEVNKKIKAMFGNEIAGEKISLTFRANGQVNEYHLPEIEANMFVAKHNITHLRTVSEYFVNGRNKPQIPQTLSEALQLAADQAKALELAAPKVAFVDNFVEVGTTKTLRETAKILKYPERKMIALLVEDKVLYRQSGNLLPYQNRHEQGLFDVKTGERNGHAYTQTRVTTKGVEWLAGRYASELMEVK
ncbi:antirepressor protein [Vibrio phage 1.168.O._10N.261.52.A10]|nr:antirepressor protein [Vibrio phage 1.168.O._10N.261.52.A10]